MALETFEQLFRDADDLNEPVSVVVIGGDITVLAALDAARDRGWVKPTVVGREEKIREMANAAALSLEGFCIIDSQQPAAVAVAEIRAGGAQLLMKGQVSTPELMRAVLDASHGLKAGRTICQVVLLEIAATGRRLLLADTGISIQPTLEQKIDILRSTVDVAHALGEPTPHVALMAATESEHDAMPETIEAAEIQRLAEQGELPGCRVHGPLSFDLAYAADAGTKKHVAGPVVGAADVMIFPNLVSANLTVKAIMYTADCQFGGVLCGAACPVVFMSRSDTVATRLNSLALALKLERTEHQIAQIKAWE